MVDDLAIDRGGVRWWRVAVEGVGEVIFHVDKLVGFDERSGWVIVECGVDGGGCKDELGLGRKEMLEDIAFKFLEGIHCDFGGGIVEFGG